MSLLQAIPQVRIIDQSGVAVQHTGNTIETVFKTVVIPAGCMGLNGRLRVTAEWSWGGGGAGNRTKRIRFGGLAGTLYYTSTDTNSTNSLRCQVDIQNRGAANSQIGNANPVAAQWAASATAVTTGAIDTSAAVDLVFNGFLALGTDTITLESYCVELILP